MLKTTTHYFSAPLKAFFFTLVLTSCGSDPADERDSCSLFFRLSDEVLELGSTDSSSASELIAYTADIDKECGGFVSNRSGSVRINLRANVKDENSYLHSFAVTESRKISFDVADSPTLTGLVSIERDYDFRDERFSLPWTDTPKKSVVYFSVIKDSVPSSYPTSVMAAIVSTQD